MNELDKIYQYKDINVSLNGITYRADKVEIDSKADVGAVYKRGDKFTSNFSTNDYVNSSLKLSYYLTGPEALKSYFTSDGSISGNINGLYFSSGYLKNYRFNASPYNPVLIDAEIVFFEGLSGQFNTNYRPSNTKITPLNYRFSSFTGVVNVDFNNYVESLSYNYEAEIIPVKKSQSRTPSEIRFNKKTVSIDILTNSLSGDMPLNGKTAAFVMTLANSGGPQEIFGCSGLINQRSFGVQAGERLANKISITQNIVDNILSISGFSPTSGYYYETVNISGIGLNSVQAIYFSDTNQNVITRTNNSQIFCQVPEGSLSGDFGYIDYFGVKRSAGRYNVLQSGITITSMTPVSGTNFEYIAQYFPDYTEQNLSNISITGRGFHNITNVFFGTGVNADSFSVNNDRNLINAFVPKGAQYDFVNVVSSRRQKTGVSPVKFVPFPVLRNYRSQAPFFGIPSGYNVFGAYVDFNGDGFSSVTGMKFNNLPSGGNPDTFNRVSNSYIYASVPSGNVRGYINLKSYSGISINSNFTFEPTIYISGLAKSKYTAGEAISIPGVFFIPELLKQNTPFTAQVEFYQTGQTQTGDFLISNYRLLSGSVPTYGRYWDVRVVSNYGGYYSNTGNSIEIVYPPLITGFFPNSIHYPDRFLVTGNNLYYVTGMLGYSHTYGYSTLNGFTINPDGKSISVPSTGGFRLDNVTGLITSKTFGVEVISPYGTSSRGVALSQVSERIQIGDIRYAVSGVSPYTPWPAYFPSYQGINTFATYSSGGAVIQQKTTLLFTPYTYQVQYDLPAIPRFNWWGSGAAYVNYYNFPRTFIVGPSTTTPNKTVPLAISGLSGNFFNGVLPTGENGVSGFSVYGYDNFRDVTAISLSIGA